MEKTSKILILGHTGLVGSSVLKELKKQGYENLLTPLKDNGKKYDLTIQSETEELFYNYKPEYVFLCAAKVGGILMNDTQSGDMIHNNLTIQTNVINMCHTYSVKKLLFLGSSCIYPKFAKQPIKEEYLLTGELEKTNIGYAVAKISGLVMCEMYRKQFGDNFISAMPTNLYGPGDNFNLENSHVLPALIRKFHEAKEENKEMVELWGSGTPKREFLYIEDLAEGLVHLMNTYNDPEIINVGVGEDVSIMDLAEIVKEVVGFNGKIIWDASKPDGTPRKLLDVTKINNTGWTAKTPLKEGIKKTYDWFVENYEHSRL